MMKKRTWKLVALAGVAALSLSLTACYVPPDDLDTSQNISSGSNHSPFQTINVTQAPTPQPTLAPVTNPPVVPVQTVNWDGNGGNPVVTAANGVTTNPIAQTTIAVLTPVPTTAGPTATPKPTNSPAPTSASLKKGSSGASVKTVQQRLKDLGYLSGSVDGDFGASTESAVKAFQRANGLSADGKVGPQTLAKLNSSSAKRASATAKPTSKPTAKPTPKATADSNIKVKNISVRQVQQRLKDLGYLSGAVDGSFGEKTLNAVMAFQRANGLTVDGKVGEQTWKKLNSTNAKRATAAPTATPRATVPSYAAKTYIRLGDSGSKTRSLQNRLIELGWLAGKADGDYGAATEAAVRAFQKKTSGLWADGVAGPDTITALYSANAARSTTPVTVSGTTLSVGMEGKAVRAMQTRLKELGYLKGSVDGTYGDATHAAVIAFQYNNGLKTDGTAGPSTLNKLYSQTAIGAGGSIGGNTDNGGSGVSSTGYVTLERDDNGQAVTDLQRALKNRGYYSGKVDGSYGADTVAAVMAFQSLNGLTVDGKAGPATQRVLFNTDGSSITYSSLQLGMSGEAVRTLQYTLYELGYYTGKVNGTYNEATSDAVRSFQYNNGLSADGKAGNQTLQKLYSSGARSATSMSYSFKTLSLGDKGEAVLELKDALMQYGYLDSDNGTNIYDKDVVAAVKEFQRKNGLPVDGIAGNDTQTKLYSNKVVRK